MEELKECPFCGSSDLMLDCECVLGCKEFSVMCRDCGACGPPKSSMTEAEDAWNVRRPMNKMLSLYEEAIASGN